MTYLIKHKVLSFYDLHFEHTFLQRFLVSWSSQYTNYESEDQQMVMPLVVLLVLLVHTL
jgi:hypothetical protein